MAGMTEYPSRAVLFEMLRSFTTLGKTLNLSHATELLGTTRQTVRRHIDALEEIKGVKLFELKHRQYFLTKDGMRNMEDAEALLRRAEAWLEGSMETTGGLSRVTVNEEDGFVTYTQQHPIYRIWKDSPPLLKRCLAAWTSAEGQIEHPAMEEIRPYIVVYRKQLESWITVSIGEESAIARWLGWVWAKSTVGCSLEADPLSSAADPYTAEAYESIVRTGGMRLDHEHTMVRRKGDGPLVPVTYHRLLVCGIFPDGQTATISLTAITNNIEIEGLDLDQIEKVPESDLMEFDLEPLDESPMQYNIKERAYATRERR